jgi:hypothetical protein
MANANPRTQQAMDYFQSKGYTKEQSAGIVGNLMQESGPNLRPDATGGYKGRAEGIAQWLGPRKEAFTKEYGVSPNKATFEQQLDFVNKELDTTERRAKNALKQTTSAEAAAVVFENKYERAGGADVNKRVANAKALMDGSAYKGPVKVPPTAPKVPKPSSNETKKPGGGYSAPTTSQAPERVADQTVQPIGVQSNILDNFSSFNCIFTLSCLTEKQVNLPDSPDSYKAGNLGRILLSAGGGVPSNRVSTAYTSHYNPEGKFEYYIDNVNIELIMSYNKRSKGTNMTDITFDVFEPYSMGTFLQSLQLAAKEQGFDNYLEAPLLLTIKFIGRDDNGEVVQLDDSLDRHLPIYLLDSNLTVNSAGCVYNITARPWNERAFADNYNLLKEDMNISGETVQQILQSGENSLQKHLNARLEEMAKQGSETGQTNYVRDEIVILFPTEEGLESAYSPIVGTTDTASPATTPADERQRNSAKRAAIEAKLSVSRNGTILTQIDNSRNKIATSNMGFDATTGGESEAVDAQTAQPDAKKATSRSATQINHASKTFRFPQGTSIINAISEILVMSNYCKDAMKDTDATGFKPWFRIEARVYLLNPVEGNDKRKRIPKLIVYNVVEYKVHSSRFIAPTAVSSGLAELTKEVVKEYNYIYSGKNTDVLNFNITLEHSAFTTTYSDRMAYANSVYPALNGIAPDQQPTPKENLDAAPASFELQGEAGEGDLHKRSTTTGGGPSENYRDLVAKNFQEALLNSPSEMLSAEMEILGDPYYIADSGMGNFSDKLSNINLTKTGTMNYQSSEVDILINFRTPVDYDPLSGQMDFGNSELVSGFSGLYQVLGVKAAFVKGKFTQTLELVRRRNQTPVDATEQSDSNEGTQVPVAPAATASKSKEKESPATVNRKVLPDRPPGYDEIVRGKGESKTKLEGTPLNVFNW